jgi:hypothetical protein
MSFFLSTRLLTDDSCDADDFDLDFDADYEFLSDEEFEVFIYEEDYDSDDFDTNSEEFCLDDIDSFGDFDSYGDTLATKDDLDEAP